MPTTKTIQSYLTGIQNNNMVTIEVLVIWFQKFFTSSIVPTIWKTVNIKPTPKSSVFDPRVSLQYRGISLLSTVYNLFSGTLNKRIVDVVDTNQLFADEQNGFQKGRSCINNIFVYSSITCKRKAKGISTYLSILILKRHLITFIANCFFTNNHVNRD